MRRTLLTQANSLTTKVGLNATHAGSYSINNVIYVSTGTPVESAAGGLITHMLFPTPSTFGDYNAVFFVGSMSGNVLTVRAQSAVRYFDNDLPHLLTTPITAQAGDVCGFVFSSFTNVTAAYCSNASTSIRYVLGTGVINGNSYTTSLQASGQHLNLTGLG